MSRALYTWTPRPARAGIEERGLWGGVKGRAAAPASTVGVSPVEAWQLATEHAELGCVLDLWQFPDYAIDYETIHSAQWDSPFRVIAVVGPDDLIWVAERPYGEPPAPDVTDPAHLPEV